MNCSSLQPTPIPRSINNVEKEFIELSSNLANKSFPEGTFSSRYKLMDNFQTKNEQEKIMLETQGAPVFLSFFDLMRHLISSWDEGIINTAIFYFEKMLSQAWTESRKVAMRGVLEWIRRKEPDVSNTLTSMMNSESKIVDSVMNQLDEQSRLLLGTAEKVRNLFVGNQRQ